MFGFHITLNNGNITQSSVNKMTGNRPLQNKTTPKSNFILSKESLKLK